MAADNKQRTDLTDPEFIARFARHLAHELNNPIGAISSAVYLIEDFVSTAESTGAVKRVETNLIDPFVKSIHEESDRLRDIVQEFVRYCATTNILSMPMDLSEFLSARAQEMSREGIPVTFGGDATPMPILADAGQIGMALRFLAMDAIRAGGNSVQIQLNRVDGMCAIELQDDRSRAPSSEDAEHAFDVRFERRDGGGLGLKLPFARKIIELHGGSITMKTIDDQTCVTILLPIRTEAETAR